MTRQENRGNSNFKNWMNFAWKLMRMPGYKSKRLKIIAGKLRSRWDGPFVITNIFPHGAVQLKDEHTNRTFQVNKHQVKPFREGLASPKNNMEIISLVEPALPEGTT
ncbi:hypothetical protein CR513_36860, partial [Mucuna pruriens]